MAKFFQGLFGLAFFIAGGVLAYFLLTGQIPPEPSNITDIETVKHLRVGAAILSVVCLIIGAVMATTIGDGEKQGPPLPATPKAVPLATSGWTPLSPEAVLDMYRRSDRQGVIDYIVGFLRAVSRQEGLPFPLLGNWVPTAGGPAPTPVFYAGGVPLFDTDFADAATAKLLSDKLVARLRGGWEATKTQLRAAAKDAADVEQLRVQLAGCLTAAEGATDPDNTAKDGDFGYSLAYEKTLQLRRDYDLLRSAMSASPVSAVPSVLAAPELGEFTDSILGQLRGRSLAPRDAYLLATAALACNNAMPGELTAMGFAAQAFLANRDDGVLGPYTAGLKLDGKFKGTVCHHSTGQVVPEDQWVLFLAKDNAFPATLRFYRAMCAEIGAEAEQLAAVDRLIGRVDVWRANNKDKLKVPDAAKGECH